jgi:hypothetical protein
MFKCFWSKINNDIDEQGTKYIPFGNLYKKLLKKHSTENIISFILHLDGVGLTRSTPLKMWLFSASVVLSCHPIFAIAVLT